MKVSILMTVYNQEGLVSQAIESILMQEVKFDYEIVIGEDCSTDRTRIVCRFAEYPAKVRVQLRDPETSERDRARGLGGKTNFVRGQNQGVCGAQMVMIID
jgi:glycosyltransferase involved in cell wall biosynthesis